MFTMPAKKLVGLDDQIVEEYLAGTSSGILGRKYQTSLQTIINLLERNGVPRRSPHDAHIKYSYDEQFFDVIDTEEKAYFLGLLYADGYNNRPDCYIALSLTDRELVERFQIALQTDHPISEQARQSSDGYTRKKKFGIKIYGEHMSSMVAAKGCHQGKSLTLTFPTHDLVPHEWVPAFCRGYFDHICGTQRFLESMAEHLPCPSFIRPRHRKPIWFLGIYRSDHVVQFAKWLYINANVWLERKRVKFTNNAHAAA